jgi:hypothetical protein
MPIDGMQKKLLHTVLATMHIRSKNWRVERLLNTYSVTTPIE